MRLPSGDHAGAVSVASSRAMGVNLYRERSVGRGAISHAASAIPAATPATVVTAAIHRVFAEVVAGADPAAATGCALLDALVGSRRRRRSWYRLRVGSL